MLLKHFVARQLASFLARIFNRNRYHRSMDAVERGDTAFVALLNLDCRIRYFIPKGLYKSDSKLDLAFFLRSME